MTTYKTNWEETRQRCAAWLRYEKTDRPLLSMCRRRPSPLEAPEEPAYRDPEELYTNADKMHTRLRRFYGSYEPVAEAFPQFSMNLGAGSLALYLGSRPRYSYDTLWFEPCIEDYARSLPLRLDPANKMYRRHLRMVDRQLELTADSDMLVCIPDLIENMDILAALREPMELCYDLYDRREQVACALEDIERAYRVAYDAFYQRVKTADGWSAYTTFDLFGPDRSAKIQCDFSAMLSPALFEELVIPSLRRQIEGMDNVLYHLDGPECLQHADALLRLDGLRAIQWTPGAGNPPTGDACWFDFYEKVLRAGKGLWLWFWEESAQDAVDAADSIVRRFGGGNLFFHFPNMESAQADRLLIRAEKEWRTGP